MGNSIIHVGSAIQKRYTTTSRKTTAKVDKRAAFYSDLCCAGRNIKARTEIKPRALKLSKKYKSYALTENTIEKVLSAYLFCCGNETSMKKKKVRINDTLYQWLVKIKVDKRIISRIQKVEKLERMNVDSNPVPLKPVKGSTPAIKSPKINSRASNYHHQVHLWLISYTRTKDKAAQAKIKAQLDKSKNRPTDLAALIKAYQIWLQQFPEKTLADINATHNLNLDAKEISIYSQYWPEHNVFIKAFYAKLHKYLWENCHNDSPMPYSLASAYNLFNRPKNYENKLKTAYCKLKADPKLTLSTKNNQFDLVKRDIKILSPYIAKERKRQLSYSGEATSS